VAAAEYKGQQHSNTQYNSIPNNQITLYTVNTEQPKTANRSWQA